MSEMMYYLRTLPNNNRLAARWIRAAVFEAACNFGGYHIRIIRNSFRFEHLQTPMLRIRPDAVLRADERLRLPMGGAAGIAASEDP
jgi:hypothetical protein